MTNPKPIYLFADSQILFWKENDQLFLSKILEYLDKDKNKENIKASYIGASNGDDPAYYEIFTAAMEQIGITNCRMILSKPDTADIDYVNLSEIILLAGGDVKKGWDVFQRNNFDKLIVDKYQKGSVLIGISAGAVQLGLKYIENDIHKSMIDTFKIIPYVIDVHNEDTDWIRLNTVIKNGEEYCKGFGIPLGGGMIFYPDWSIEAVRYSLTEVINGKEGKVNQSMILPLSRNYKNQ